MIKDNWLQQVRLEELDGDQKEIAETIGMDAYRKLVKAFGGNQIRIYQEATLTRPIRDAEIRQKYNGHNELWLSRHYGLSDRVIREITQGQRRIDGQCSIWDDAKD